MDFISQNNSNELIDRNSHSLFLTKEQLEQEITKVLKANNPTAPDNIVRFSLTEQRFISIPKIDQTAYHLVLESNLVHILSDEAKNNKFYQSEMCRQSTDSKNIVHLSNEESQISSSSELLSSKEQTLDKDIEEIVKPHQGLGDRLKFTDRGTQFSDSSQKNFGFMTDPLPRKIFGANVSQGEIFDAYKLDFEAQLEFKEIEKNPNRSEIYDRTKVKKISSKAFVPSTNFTAEKLERFMISGLVIERMLCMNNFSEIVSDFKYYDDPSVGASAYSMNGSVLPLWKFRHKEVTRRKLSITHIKFSTAYNDLFFVSYGPYEFSNDTPVGLVLGYSLKKSTSPDFLIRTNSGVLSIDISIERKNLMVLGMADGSVAVYSISQSKLFPNNLLMDNFFTLPIYKSVHNNDSKIGQHFAPCWQVRWLPFPEIPIDKETKRPLKDKQYQSFLSVGLDGRLLKWTLKQHELEMDQLFRASWHINEKEIEISQMLNKINTRKFVPKTTMALLNESKIDIDEEIPTSLHEGICCFDIGGLREVTLGMNFQFDPSPTANLDLLSNLKTTGVRGVLNMNENKLIGKNELNNLPATIGGVGEDETSTVQAPIISETTPSREILSYPPSDLSLILGMESGRIFLCKALDRRSDPIATEWSFKQKSAVQSGGSYIHGDAHQMSVYTIQWHPFSRDVFATCSCDWLFKIWHINYPEAKLTFELGAPIVDFSWCPYLGAVFACLLADGNIVIFNISVNKYRPIIKQLVVGTQNGNYPTQLRFSSTLPIILVGDKKGQIVSFKLPPNLRRPKDSHEKYEKPIEITPSLIEEEETKIMFAIGFKDPND